MLSKCNLYRYNSEEDNQNIPAVSYELPDGNTIDVGVERFKIPELIFQPHLLPTLGLGDDAPDLKMAGLALFTALF